MSSRPSTRAPGRSGPTNPLDEEPNRESSAPPMPSSRTTTRSHPPCSVQPDAGPRGMGVLGHVGQQLGHTEVGDGLDGRGRPTLQRKGELGGDRAARRQGGQRTLEPDVERRGMDAAGQVPQFDDGLLGAPVRVVPPAVAPGRDRVLIVSIRPTSPWPCRGAWPGPPTGPGCRRADRARSAATWPPRSRRSGPGPVRASARGPRAASGASRTRMTRRSR